MGWYTDEQIASLRARILEQLQAGPVARIDLPELVDATDYLIQRVLRPLLKAGTIRARAVKRQWDRPHALGGCKETVATCYELTEQENTRATR